MCVRACAFSIFTSDLLEMIVRYTNFGARRRILQVPWLKIVWKDVDLVHRNRLYWHTYFVWRVFLGTFIPRHKGPFP